MSYELRAVSVLSLSVVSYIFLLGAFKRANNFMCLGCWNFN